MRKEQCKFLLSLIKDMRNRMALFQSEIMKGPRHYNRDILKKLRAEMWDQDEYLTFLFKQKIIVRGEKNEIRKEYPIDNILQYRLDFYKSLGLEKIAKEMPKRLLLEKPEYEKFKQRINEGYDKLFIMPADININFQEFLGKIQENCQEDIRINGWPLTDKAISYLRSVYRPKGGFYLLMMKESSSVDEGTLNVPSYRLQEICLDKGLYGLTVAEYIIFALNSFREKGQLPDTENATFLLDSRIGNYESVPFAQCKKPQPNDKWKIDIKHNEDKDVNWGNEKCGTRFAEVIEL